VAKYTKLNILTDLGCDVIEEILDELGVTYQCKSQRISGACPIHEGNNGGAFNMYPQNQRGPRGIWCCYTHGCEKKYGKNLVGFIRGMLSKESANTSYDEVVRWLCRFLGFNSLNDIKISPQDEERQGYVNTYEQIMRWSRPSQNGHWKREQILSKLQVPAQFYLDKKYSEDILYMYDVGYYPPYNRVVIPIYDDDYKFAIGFTKRAVGKGQQPKWLHSEGFNANNSLYNFWFSRKEIQNTKTAILVEGPGDVWRLEENGIHNSVAIFKNSISEQQIYKLLNCEVMSIIVMLDNDTAGHKGARQIHGELSSFVRLFFPTIHGGDVGELQKDHITEDILPLINQVGDIYG